MHDGMLYDLIQGQGLGSQKIAKMADYLLRRYACSQKTMVNYDTPRQYF